MLPFVKLHEWIKYGGYASNTAMDGFAKSTAAVMILHSFDDEVVPVEYGYDAAENKERFSADKADYIHQNLDRDKWCHSIDAELFEDFVEFYDNVLN